MDFNFVELLAESPREMIAVDIAVKATLVLAAAGVVTAAGGAAANFLGRVAASSSGASA